MGHQGSNQGPLGLQPIALPLSYIPAAYRFNNITANTLRLFEHCYNVFCSESSVLSRSMSFFLVFQKLYKGTPGFEQGPPLGMQLHDLPSSYIPAAYRFNNITANTCRLFEHCYIIFCSESNVLSRSMSGFSSLSKIIQRDTRAQTRDLSDCSRMLYHWAISPLHTDSITSLQTRSGCSSTVTMFFVPSQVYSRDQCIFFLVSQKLYKETPGFEPGTSRTAAAWSTPSYIPAAYRFNTITANTCRLFEHCYNVFCSESMFSRDRCHFSLVFQKLYKATPGFAPGTSRTADECSTTALYPRCMHIQEHHCKHVQVVWALLQCFLFRFKCTLAIDVFFPSSFKNYTRGHPGSNQGPLGLQPNALPLSYITAPRCIQIQ